MQSKNLISENYNKPVLSCIPLLNTMLSAFAAESVACERCDQ